MRRSVYSTTSFSVCSLRRAKFPIIYPDLRLNYKVATHPFAQGGGRMRRRFRPGESVRVLRPDRDEHDARAQLRHAEIRSVKQAPVCHVAELRESAADVGAIDFKDRVEHAAHILKHYGAGPGLIDDIDGGGKQVPVVICAELLESGRFRGSGGCG